MSQSGRSTNLFDVRGIVAVVTGGGSGLGLSMTRALAENGAKKVYILARRQQILEDAVKEIGLDNVIPIQCDVTDRENLKAAAKLIEDEVRYINLLVANSGTAGPSGSVQPDATIEQVQDTLFNIPMEDFTNAYHVNCTTVFYTSTAFLHLLEQRKNSGYPGGRSQVIATSSIGGFRRKTSAGFAYTTSKAATTMMIKVLATYLVRYRIRANAMCPAIFPTDMTANMFEGDDLTVEGALPAEIVPAERAGAPEDIMGPLLYLASRAGTCCNRSCVLTVGARLSVMPSTY